MAGRLELSVLLLLVLAPSARGLLLTNDNSPSLIDQLLQVIWEPSSLIRMWVGLDQLYNIALSWRGVAKNLASLPFGEGRSSSHVTIQEPRSLKYHKPSVASQWDRFNKIYASSSLSPIVAHARSRHVLPPLQNYGHNVLENDLLGLSQKLLFGRHAYGPRNLPPFGNYGNNVFQGHLFDSSRQQDVFLSPGSLKSPSTFWNVEDPLMVSPTAQQPLDLGSQKKLTAFLGLLRTLGDIHAKEVGRDRLETSDV